MMYEYLKSNNCTEIINDSLPNIVCNENGKTYKIEFNNRTKAGKIRIDGCLISGNTQKKCDFLCITFEYKKAFFVELKGTDDIFEAYEQIKSSIIDLSQKQEFIELQDYQINARIVLARLNNPNIKNDPKTLKFKKFLKKYKNGDVGYNSISYVESI